MLEHLPQSGGIRLEVCEYRTKTADTMELFEPRGPWHGAASLPLPPSAAYARKIGLSLR
jgi:hypothetical protein